MYRLVSDSELYILLFGTFVNKLLWGSIENMKHVLNLYKEIGETPLERIERFVKDNPEYEDRPMTYAGRLDPMAEGVLLILTGPEVHKKQYYNGLTKEYESEFLFGIETDTFDVLGKVVEVSDDPTVPFKKLLSELPSFEGMQKQKMPPFASEKMNGTALWRLARDGEIGPDDTPEKEIEIQKIEMQKMSEISKDELLKEIERRIKKTKGDFRQKEILMTWEESLRLAKPETFQILRVRIGCGSGTYVRRIAYDLGKRLGLPALALSIKRTKVGSYFIDYSEK